MTVSELIERLSTQKPDADVFLLLHDNASGKTCISDVLDEILVADAGPRTLSDGSEIPQVSLLGMRA